MEQNKFRCHFSIVIENLGSVFWFLVVILFSEIDSTMEIVKAVSEGKASVIEIFAATGVVLGILLVMLIFNVVIWSKTWISIESDAIVIEKRFLNRKVNTIGIKNISNINTEQNLFERLLGTYKIKLDTNSATTAEDTDVKIVLSKKMAEQFKQQVTLRMNEYSKEATADVVGHDVQYDVEYKAKDIVMHCIYTASTFSVIFLFAVIIGFIVGIKSLDTGAFIVDSIINLVGSMIAIALIVGSVIQSLVKDFFVYYGFKARRQGNKIYLSHGLFKKRQYTVAVDKINAVQMVSSAFSRILGRQYVKLVCIGVGDEQNENAMLLLSEKTGDMNQKLSVLLPEFVIERPEITKREKQSVWNEIPGFVVLLIFTGTFAVTLGIMDLLEIETMWIRILIVVSAVLINIFTLIGVYWNFKTCGIGVGQDVLLIEEGVFAKKAIWIQYSKIQELEYTQGPISRHFGMAKGMVTVLAKMVDSIHATSYYKLEVFDQIRQKMLERKAKRV